MKRLFIFEDGTLTVSENPVFDDELESIEDGVLTVIRYLNGEFYELEASGMWSVMEVDPNEETKEV